MQNTAQSNPPARYANDVLTRLHVTHRLISDNEVSPCFQHMWSQYTLN